MPLRIYVDTSLILLAPENYPVDVVKYAQSHKRADRIYWIDKSNRKLAKSLDNARKMCDN